MSRSFSWRHFLKKADLGRAAEMACRSAAPMRATQYPLHVDSCVGDVPGPACSELQVL